MPGDPLVYLPAFGVGGLACAWYLKQVFSDGREPNLSMLFFCLSVGYSAVIAILLVVKTLWPELGFSLEPYRRWYVVAGGVGIFGYAIFGLKQNLFDWNPMTSVSDDAQEEESDIQATG